MDLGAVLNVAAGWSSANNDNIERLQGGAHDPKRRGFTLQQLELGMKGALDPYFTGKAYIVFSEEGAELEEAFFTTTSLPYTLQLEGGYFLTEFGRNNPRHPDQWYWVDQPVINTRLFGGEGTRAAGFRLSGLLLTPWYSALHFGMQDPTSETAVSFKGEPPGHAHGEGHSHGNEEEDHNHEADGEGEAGEEGLEGFARIGENEIQSPSDLLYLGRWVNRGEITSAWSAQLGLSVLYGSNTTGPDGETWIYGADLITKWRPARNVQTGLDLEVGWARLLLENSRNAKIQPGAPGYVDASEVITPLEVPTVPVTRLLGDVHPSGNPHYLADPINGLRVAKLLRDRLIRLQPASRSVFEDRYEQFATRLARALVGNELAARYDVEDVEKLAILHERGELADYLKSQGELDQLGGWLGKMQPHRGAQVVADHNMWPYFAQRFGIEVVGYMEPKPGIPPTTKHLKELVEQMQAEDVSVVVTSAYYDPPAMPSFWRAIPVRKRFSLLIKSAPGREPGIISAWWTTMYASSPLPSMPASSSGIPPSFGLEHK